MGDDVNSRGDADAAARRDWLWLVAATVGFGLGFGVYSGLLANFLPQHLGLGRQQLGQVEALREVPGLLIAGIVGALAWLPEPRLAVLGLLLAGTGVALLGRAEGFASAALFQVINSVGLHLWLTVHPAITMALSPKGRQGYGLGLVGAYQSAAVLSGLAVVFFVGDRLSFATGFAAAGLVMALGALCAARVPPHRGGGLQRRLLFRPKYWLYYALMVLDGGRRQLIVAFNTFILVNEFGASKRLVAFMLFLNTAATMVASRHAGAWTDRAGERRTLTAYYLGVILIFLAYTCVPPGGVMLFCALYAIDNLLFTLAVGIPTYARRIAPPEELSSTLAMGLTMNHVSAVSVPLVAGWIWETLGYQRIYLCGVAIALVALAAARAIPPRPPRD